MQKVQAQQHAEQLSSKLIECNQSLSKLQASLKKQDEVIATMEASKRQLEQLHEDGVEKIRQLEFAESQACEERDKAEESYVLLLCEMEGIERVVVLYWRTAYDFGVRLMLYNVILCCLLELRGEKQEMEDRLKAELTELQAEIADLLERGDNM